MALVEDIVGIVDGLLVDNVDYIQVVEAVDMWVMDNLDDVDYIQVAEAVDM